VKEDRYSPAAPREDGPLIKTPSGENRQDPAGNGLAPDKLSSQKAIQDLAQALASSSATNESQDWLASVTQRVRCVRTLTVELLIGVLLVWGAIFIWQETSPDRIDLLPLDLPPVLQEQGYTGEMIATRLLDKTNEIKRIAETNQPGEITVYRASDLAEIKVPGTGAPLQSFIRYFSEFFDRSPTRVRGEFIADSTNLHLTIRVDKQLAKRFTTTLENPELALTQAAQHIMRSTQPIVLAYYLSRFDDTDATQEIIRYCLSHPPKFDDSEANNLWGGVLIRLGDDAGAIEKFERAIKLDPEYAEAYNNWGVALSNLGDDAGAIEKYEQAIELDPELAKAYNNWGVALLELGDADEIEKYERAIEFDPELAMAYNNWGAALSRLDDDAGAIEKYEQAIELDPEFALAYANWGFALSNLDDDVGAIEKYEQAIEFYPEFEFAYTNWGAALSRLGDDDGAIEKFERAIKFNPESAEAYKNWGTALRNLGDDVGATEKFAMAAELASPPRTLTYISLFPN
jgi:tetratricopeptide (TPR) repeat protein